MTLLLGIHFLSIQFLPGTALPSHLSLCLENLAWQAKLETSKIWPDRNVNCTSLVGRILLMVASSGVGLSMYSFLLVIFGSGSRSWKDSIFCVFFGDAFLHPSSCSILPGIFTVYPT